MAYDTLPYAVALKDGRQVVIEGFMTTDADALVAFYHALPEEDRIVLKDDVTTEGWAERFLQRIASREIVSLVAKTDDQVLAEASLYRSLHGWMRHVGEIRLTVGKPWRRQGLGLAIAGTVVKVATDLGIEKIIVQMVENQIGARRTFAKLGFHQEAVLPRHVCDLSGKKRDLIIMANDVSQIWASMEALVTDYNPHSGE